MSGARISAIAPLSPAAQADLRVGDELKSVNGHAPTDVIEYQQLVDGSRVELVLHRPGESLDRRVVVAKEEGIPLGIAIDSAVFDRIRTCDNHCSFCFIYQLPKGLRRSLYVKDDDYRLSFLYGNYTTLTRFTELDLERVIDEGLSPLYVSIHTTDPELRASMLRNPRGASSLRWLRALLEAGVEVHGQIVLCPQVNDGPQLDRTLADVLTEYPRLASVTVVPVGVSDFSTEAEMRPHEPEEARQALEQVHRWADVARERLGRNILHASDELYLIAGLRPPAAPEGLDLAENGVGLVEAFATSFTRREEMATLGTGFFQSVDGAPAWGYRAERSTRETTSASGPLAVLTGEYAAPLLEELLRSEGFDDVAVVPVTNRFFGGNIKVAGLLTGSDLSRALGELDDGTACLIPDVCLNEDRFLDGLTLADLPREVTVVPTTGRDLREAVESARGGAR